MLHWVRDDDPRWDADRARIFGTVPAGVFREQTHTDGARLPSDWWQVRDDERVVGYGWLDDVWGDAEILLAVEAAARGTGAGRFALGKLEQEAAARGLNYVVNVVRDTHPDRAATTAWFLAHGFTGTDDGRLRKRVGQEPRAAGAPTGSDAARTGGRQARYEAERDRAVAHRGEASAEPESVDGTRGPGHEESGGYVDPEQHRY